MLDEFQLQHLKNILPKITPGPWSAGHPFVMVGLDEGQHTELLFMIKIIRRLANYKVK